MINLLAFCVCVSLACLSIHTVITRPGMVLYFAYPHLNSRLPEWLKKPLFDCLICMSSFWTIFFYFILHPVLKSPITDLGVCICVVAGINIIICAILENISDGC